jgi:hypothetical protein|nr:MAG TPA: hypothetical protein [Caudoviricetes sp.]
MFTTIKEYIGTKSNTKFETKIGYLLQNHILKVSRITGELYFNSEYLKLRLVIKPKSSVKVPFTEYIIFKPFLEKGCSQKISEKNINKWNIKNYIQMLDFLNEK